MAPVFSTNECYRRLQYESVVPKKIYPLRHGVSFVVLCSPFVHYEVGVTSQCMVITCYIPLSEVLFTIPKIFRRLEVAEEIVGIVKKCSKVN